MKISAQIQKIKEAILEHEEIAKLRTKFAELDPRAQQIVIGSSLGGTALVLLVILISLLATTHSKRKQIQELNTSTQYLEKSSDKLDLLRRKVQEQSFSAGAEIDKNLPFAAYIEKVIARAAIAKESSELSNQKTIPTGKASESSMDLKLSKISIRQLVRFLFFIETSKNGIAINKLSIDEKDNHEGYLWATVLLKKIDAPKK